MLSEAQPSTDAQAYIERIDGVLRAKLDPDGFDELRARWLSEQVVATIRHGETDVPLLPNDISILQCLMDSPNAMAQVDIEGALSLSDNSASRWTIGERLTYTRTRYGAIPKVGSHGSHGSQPGGRKGDRRKGDRRKGDEKGTFSILFGTAVARLGGRVDFGAGGRKCAEVRVERRGAALTSAQRETRHRLRAKQSLRRLAVSVFRDGPATPLRRPGR